MRCKALQFFKKEGVKWDGDFHRFGGVGIPMGTICKRVRPTIKIYFEIFQRLVSKRCGGLRIIKKILTPLE